MSPRGVSDSSGASWFLWMTVASLVLSSHPYSGRERQKRQTKTSQLYSSMNARNCSGPSQWFTSGASSISMRVLCRLCFPFQSGCSIISFGSLYSPSRRPDLLETLVESLLSVDPPFPFLFATATIGHVISDRVRRLVADSGGRGMITGFAPQLHVLQHRATGWFLVRPKFLLSR